MKINSTFVIITSLTIITSLSFGVFISPVFFTNYQENSSDISLLGTVENPVKCYMPAAEQAYLNKLRCVDGVKPTIKLIGHLSPTTGKNIHILNKYNLICKNSKFRVYTDIYNQTHEEFEPVPGFSIVF